MKTQTRNKLVASVVMAVVVMLTFFARPDFASGQDTEGGVIYMNKGIAPVPAFGTDHGATYFWVHNDFGRIKVLIDWAFIDGRSEDEDGNVGDMWFFDPWLHVYPVDGENTKMRFGFNWAPFGQPYGSVQVVGQPEPDIVREITRYFITEWHASHEMKSGDVISLTWWHNFGMDTRTIDGEYVSLKFAHKFNFGDVTLKAQPDLFVTSFTGENDGFFFSGSLGLSHDNAPFSLGFQYVNAFSTNVPDYEPSWNVSLGWSF